MEILFISAWFPFPQDNGSRIRVYHLLKALNARALNAKAVKVRHNVHFVSFIPSQEERVYWPDLDRLCASVHVVEREPFWRNPQLKLRGRFKLTPRDVISGYSSQMAGLVSDLVSKQHYDLVIASTLEMAPYALLVYGPPRILEEHNFMTQWMEERYRSTRGLFNRASSWIGWWKCRRYERWLYPNFECVSMVSEHDRQAVRRVMPDYPGRLEVLPNGVDLETCTPRMVEPLPDQIIFNGSLTYDCNLEAMIWFTKHVYELIKKDRPGVRLVITGRTGGVDLTRFKNDPAICLTGFMQDIRPLVAGSWLAVAPLLSGSGTRLKILEAMALGTPVVATRKGAEGLDITPGREILIADEPYDFAWQCLSVLENKKLRQELSVSGRNLVEKRYGWDMIGDKFCSLIEAIAGEGNEDFL